MTLQHLLKMKKIMLLLGFLSFFLVSCGVLNTTNSNGDIPDIHKGTVGLTMEFLKNTPPKEVFEETQFPILLRVHNQGTYSLENEDVLLTLGLERSYTKSIILEETDEVNAGSTESEALFYVGGKTIANPRGDQEVVSFTATAGKIDPQSEAHPTTVIATLCYPYKTEFTTDVCVDRDPNNIYVVKKACNVQDISLGGGQGAPVAVSKVEVQMLPLEGGQGVRPQFIFHVENKGRGEVINLDFHKDFCRSKTGDFDHRNINAVQFSAKLSNQNLKCSTSLGEGNGGLIRLRAKSDRVRCTIEEGLDTEQISYVSPLVVVMEYGYTESMSARYLINKQG